MAEQLKANNILLLLFFPIESVGKCSVIFPPLIADFNAKLFWQIDQRREGQWGLINTLSLFFHFWLKFKEIFTTRSENSFQCFAVECFPPIENIHPIIWRSASCSNKTHIYIFTWTFLACCLRWSLFAAAASVFQFSSSHPSLYLFVSFVVEREVVDERKISV